jgi:SAM-dependent methyltransferase
MADPPALSGVLLQSPGSHHGDRVFFCRRGRRHYVKSADWLAEHGFVWPDDLQFVAPSIIDAFEFGPPAPRRYSDEHWRNPPRHSTDVMREILVSRLHGTGIEVGAGQSPTAVPLDCVVRYADIHSIDELHVYFSSEGKHPGDIVPPDLRASLDDMSAVPDGSVDFVIARHVIEHVSDPIGAMINNWAKLRPGGSLVYAVPEMTRTLDRHRALTTLSHLIEDHADQETRRERDKAHFREFYRLALPLPAHEYESGWMRKWSDAFPIHYHTWTYNSFREMVAMLTGPDGRLANAEVWSQPPLDDAVECYEFWFCLTKPKP